MHVPFQVVLAAAGAFVLGARHGLDWDHLAAITDLAGGPGSSKRRSLALAVWYCVGHGLVIVLLGALVGVMGVRLPAGLDRVFEVVVGATLVLLGLLVLAQVARQRGSYEFRSRWRVLFGVVARVWLRRRGRAGTDVDAGAGPVSRPGAFAIGLLHGTGAETPTQVVLFATAATAGSAAGGALVLLGFVLGLVVSDVGVAALWLSGRLGAVRVPGGAIALGVLTGVASVAVGIAFILQRSAMLPSLLGG
jgi:sulfite exporter TauE/SafE